MQQSQSRNQMISHQSQATQPVVLHNDDSAAPMLSELQRKLQHSGIFHRLPVIIVSAIAVSLGSCSNAPLTHSDSPQAKSIASQKELQVITTFIPITVK
jgi:hypothetical protein